MHRGPHHRTGRKARRQAGEHDVVRDERQESGGGEDEESERCDMGGS